MPSGELVEIGRPARHQAAVVGANIPDADVITHNHDDVGLLLRGCRRARHHHGIEQRKQTEAGVPDHCHSHDFSSVLAARIGPAAGAR